MQLKTLCQSGALGPVTPTLHVPDGSYLWEAEHHLLAHVSISARNLGGASECFIWRVAQVSTSLPQNLETRYWNKCTYRH